LQANLKAKSKRYHQVLPKNDYLIDKKN